MLASVRSCFRTANAMSFALAAVVFTGCRADDGAARSSDSDSMPASVTAERPADTASDSLPERLTAAQPADTSVLHHEIARFVFCSDTSSVMPIVSPEGIGPLHLGMSASRVRDACESVRDTSFAAGMRLAVFDHGVRLLISLTYWDSIETIRVLGGPVATQSGVRVGSSRADVEASYPETRELDYRRAGSPFVEYYVCGTRSPEEIKGLLSVISVGGLVFQFRDCLARHVQEHPAPLGDERVIAIHISNMGN